MHRIRCLQIDAFADRPFTGNPAAVCLLQGEAEAEWMQAAAMEMNLAETAFVRPLGDDFELRWFTPTMEADLCGHATLATAHALWTEGVVPQHDAIRFHTRSGVLTCESTDNWISLDFPALPVTPVSAPMELAEALGVTPVFVGRSSLDLVAVVESPELVESLSPDLVKLRALPVRGVAVTASTNTAATTDRPYDFVSRFFAPAAGIDEDPVTGSAHCSLGPYWAEQLGSRELVGYQASRRGGLVRMSVNNDRVILSGQAVTVLDGQLVG